MTYFPLAIQLLTHRQQTPTLLRLIIISSAINKVNTGGVKSWNSPPPKFDSELEQVRPKNLALCHSNEEYLLGFS